MVAPKSTRRVYSAEELHQLRTACSQPKIREAIQENDGDDAELVKEHVLRGTKAFSARSLRSRTSCNSLQVPANKENRSTLGTDSSLLTTTNASSQNGALGSYGTGLVNHTTRGQFSRYVPSRYRPSPTPSLKKAAVEAIVKAHGSPQHVRVTAGGRIVPSEQSPLCHPRFGYSAIKANGGLIKFAPNHPLGKAQWTQATQNGFVAQDIEGRLCQIVDGTILPLNEIDGALRLYVPAPNLNITSHSSSFGQGPRDRSAGRQDTSGLGKPQPTADIMSETHMQTLRAEYSQLEQQLKDLDKTEALHGRTMARPAKNALVTRRRELVTHLDTIRKTIKHAQTTPPAGAPRSPRAMREGRSVSPSRTHAQPPTGLHPLNHQMSLMPPGTFWDGVQAPHPPPPFGFPVAQHTMPGPMDVSIHHPFHESSAGPSFMAPPSFDGLMMPQPFMPVYGQPLPFGPPGFPPMHGNGDANALAFYLPQSDGARSFTDLPQSESPQQSNGIKVSIAGHKSGSGSKSGLNPMSPAYQPDARKGRSGLPGGAVIEARAQTPQSPIQTPRPALATNAAARSTVLESPHKRGAHLHSSSVSSFSTADFFPRDTNEYSTRGHTRPVTTPTEDKENVDPVQKIHQTIKNVPCTGSPLSKSVPDDGGGTSTQLNARPALIRPSEASSDADRAQNNMSPKQKLVEQTSMRERHSETSTQCGNLLQTISSPTIDFSSASSDWIAGYRCGLSRTPIGADRAGDFLDGYCAGLLKSKPVVTKSTEAALRPSVVATEYAENPPAAPKTPLEAFRAAIVAPENEEAVLSPIEESPPTDEQPHVFGSWADRISNKPSAAVTMPQLRNDKQRGAMSDIPPISDRTAPVTRVTSSSAKTMHGEGRVISLMSVDSAGSHPFRSFSPLEWRATSSIASPEGTATGYFASGQYDGANKSCKIDTLDCQRFSPTAKSGLSDNYQSRFHEDTSDDLTEVAHAIASPSRVMSPHTHTSVESTGRGKGDSASPSKTSSPAKARFEQIAEKVGLRSNATPPRGSSSSARALSPPGSPTSNGKRRWRDVWRTSPKKDD